jgi:hypothetical protein
MGAPMTRESTSCILNILNDFSEALGTSINTDKSHIFFFNTPHVLFKPSSLASLGFNRSSLPSKYLGIPLIDNAL